MAKLEFEDRCVLGGIHKGLGTLDRREDLWDTIKRLVFWLVGAVSV